MNRRSTLLSIISAILFTLSLSGLAAAQSNDPWWGRDRNRDDRRDRRRDQRDDGYYGRDNGYGRYDSRTLRDAAQRIKDRSRDFERDVDRALDHSRVDGTRREDNINDTVKDFRRAADRFKDRIGNGNDANRAYNEARELIQRANQIDRVISRARLDSRAASDWNSLNQDLRLVASAYNLSYNGGGYYGNGSYDPRYPNDRRNRRNNNNDWLRQLPNIIRP
ncbi:MAG TPA: hypothetical protein VF525_04255 [Pyrinomonadaceae bacterium]|jgi:hypothetical protein